MWSWIKREWSQVSTKAGSVLLAIATALSATPQSLAQFEPKIAWGIAGAGAILVLFRGKVSGAE